MLCDFLHASVLIIYFLYQKKRRNIRAQNEADIQELCKEVEILWRRVKVCMLAYMDWNIIGPFVRRLMHMKIIAP